MTPSIHKEVEACNPIGGCNGVKRKDGTWDRVYCDKHSPIHKEEEHTHKEGSRGHVIHYDAQGIHCSEPNCEINAGNRKSQTHPTKRDKRNEKTKSPKKK